MALAATAVLLALREPPAPSADPAGRAPAVAEVATIPLVLAVDPAYASVLRPGQRVDLYAATGDQPPALTAAGLALLDIRQPSAEGHDFAARPAWVVVGVPPGDTQLIGSLIAAEVIVATVSAQHP
ncbi:hypothetical protein [Cumulibacter manganitolerans]|uniref:hypothetical protein n=1 Tax=Cumulibacter manganitolerans TaxID=1884992 RepID=UPI00129743B2|nr:hypothetical protein [Cumulibacter manganitolerans]